MVETRALRYAYPDGPVLSFDDIDVPQGGTLLLHGISGVGKSTWLALAAGLLTPDQGEIVMARQPLSSLSHGARYSWRARNVGFLPQRLHLSDAISVAKNLSLAFYAAGMPDNPAIVKRALTLLGVADLAHRRPSQQISLLSPHGWQKPPTQACPPAAVISLRIAAASASDAEAWIATV